MGSEEEKPEISPDMAKAMKDRLRLAENMEKIKHKLVIMSGKGGVGKSTIAANLACILAKNNRVGLLDADITGPDIPMIMGIEGLSPRVVDNRIEPIGGPLGIKVISMGQLLPSRDAAVVWRGPMKMAALRQFLSDVIWGSLDYLIIDLPPGTSDEPLSIAQEIPEATGAIIITTPQELSLLDVRKSINFSNAVKLHVLGIIENMSGFTCPKCGYQVSLFKKGGGKKAAKEMKIPFLGSIPIDQDVVVGGDAGKPFVLENPDSETNKAFMKVVKKIEKEIANIKQKPKFKPVGSQEA